jgi:cysteine synthase A
MHSASPHRVDAAIGRTAIAKLERVAEPGSAEIWIKLEGLNPGGSIKDRTALGMIVDAESRGLLQPGGRIVEPTSGNTGIGLAQVAAARGYRLVLCIPASMSDERKRTLLAYGAEIVLTDPDRRMLAAIEEAERIRDATGAWMPNQFNNPANPRIHYETTAPELWDQMDGRIDAFVYGSGTGGTISGVGRFLKERRPGTLVVAVEPARSPVLSGGVRGPHQFQGMGPGFVPQNFDRSVVDRIVRPGKRTRSRWRGGWRRRKGCSSACRAGRSPAPRWPSRASSVPVIVSRALPPTAAPAT